MRDPSRAWGRDDAGWRRTAAIIDALVFGGTGRLAGRRALVTAGPTREPIDPVRWVGNHSTGRTGLALAVAAFRLITFWIWIPVGWFALGILNRHRSKLSSTTPAVPETEGQ